MNKEKTFNIRVVSTDNKEEILLKNNIFSLEIDTEDTTFQITKDNTNKLKINTRAKKSNRGLRMISTKPHSSNTIFIEPYEQ